MHIFVVFTDKCKACGHLVASHVFRFRVEGDFQVPSCSVLFLKSSIIDVRILTQASLAVHANQNNFCGMQDCDLASLSC